MQTQTISSDVRSNILNSFADVGSVAIPFCVDGRDGAVEFASDPADNHLFVQSLGGSLGIAVVRMMADPDTSKQFGEVLETALADMGSAGLPLGVHRDSHAHGDASGCGFADNLPKIISRLATEHQEIKDTIDSVAPGVIQSEVWARVAEDARVASEPQKHVSGEELVASSVNAGANLQNLEGNHEEVAAVVNLLPETTLNTGKLVDDGLQAFNLDLWYVLQQAKVLDLDPSYVTHAILGLYVATEMVLVEDKKNVRLPIIVRS